MIKFLINKYTILTVLGGIACLVLGALFSSMGNFPLLGNVFVALGSILLTAGRIVMIIAGAVVAFFLLKALFKLLKKIKFRKGSSGGFMNKLFNKPNLGHNAPGVTPVAQCSSPTIVINNTNNTEKEKDSFKNMGMF